MGDATPPKAETVEQTPENRLLVGIAVRVDQLNAELAAQRAALLVLARNASLETREAAATHVEQLNWNSFHSVIATGSALEQQKQQHRQMAYDLAEMIRSA